MAKLLKSDPEFLSKLIQIALPIMIENLITSTLTFIDVFLVGQLGETAVSAVGIGNQIFFVFMIFVFGIANGTAIFTAQYWGRGNIGRIQNFLGIGLIFALLVSFAFAFIAIAATPFCISLFTTNPNVIRQGVDFLYVIGYSFPFTAITILFATVMCSTENVRVPMIASCLAVSINTLLNYALIFGHWGFPPLGVKGSAIATLTARIVEFAAMMSLCYIGKYPVAQNFWNLILFNRKLIMRFMKKALPVAIQGFLWSLGFAVYSSIYGHLDGGSEGFAAFNIAASVEKFFGLIYVGLAAACSVITGNKIGAGSYEIAKKYSRKFLAISLISSVFLCLIMILIRGPIIGFYNISEKSQMYTCQIILVMAFLLICKSLNTILNLGILRGGGDTFFSMTIDIGSLWLVGIPAAYFTAFHLELSIPFVVMATGSEECVKIAAGFWRFLSGKWIHHLTERA
ncbi:MAG: MATE family efflux transporter [Oligoflexales bacterium]|nr:MATE family efflux transporter [Oligoflexales bacterium]